MIHSRREFLKTAAVTGRPSPRFQRKRRARPRHFGASHGIAKLFDGLPGDLGFKIRAPSRKGKPGFTVQANADKVLFAASAIKTFALCEALRQADSPDIDNALQTKELPLDARVWSPGSPIFNPPNLSGVISERTALEAMILRSDNTATDMIFNLAGADNIRKLIASAGLVKTRVPDNTRIFSAYLSERRITRRSLGTAGCLSFSTRDGSRIRF